MVGIIRERECLGGIEMMSFIHMLLPIIFINTVVL
jgi:hypothetical protein